MAIRTDHADPQRRRVLFEGYPLTQEMSWDGRGGGSNALRIRLEHVYGELARSPESQIFGRRVRSAAIEDGVVADPERWSGASVLAEALPCVFNLDGRPNCSPVPLRVRDAEGRERHVYIFTYDGDPEAIPWTFARVLRYLVWFYRSVGCVVREGNVFSATEPYVDLPPAAVGSEEVDDALGRALVSQPESLTCEATNLVEALALVTEAAGIHIAAETETEVDSGGRPTGRPQSRLRIWAVGDGALRWLHLAPAGTDGQGRPLYDPQTKTVEEILQDNDTYRARIVWDSGPVVNQPIVVSGVKRYELTVELVPGWRPEADLDDVSPEEADDAKSLALLPAELASLGSAAEAYSWFRKYHRRGSEFAAHADVARRWVLNEHGRYRPEDYNRSAPFDDYRPFDFAAVLGVEARGWMRRPRRFLPPLTRLPDGREAPVWVEVSFDGGGRWEPPACPVRVLTEECGIVFACGSPTELAPAGVDPSRQNLWYALIDGTFRVRVTASVEGDERLTYVLPAGSVAGPTGWVAARLIYRPATFGFARRVAECSVLAQAWPDAPTAERDDTDAAKDLAQSVAAALRGRRIRAVPAIPWIETDIAIGDRLAGVRGRGVSLAASVGVSAGYPVVVGKVYRLHGGRYETELLLDRGADA